MIETKPRLDACGEQPVDQAIVERKTGFVGCPASLRQHARPRNGKPVRLDAKPLHQGYIFAVTMIVVARHVAGVVVGDRSCTGVDVPDAWPAAILVCRPLDLIARG